LKRIPSAILIVAALAQSGWAKDQTAEVWTLARSEHFEVYSERGGENPRMTIEWLERLCAFFEQTGLPLQSGRVVRVIAFDSASSYAPYRLTATSDAYYLGTDTRDYVVVPTANESQSTVAAHEYAHAHLRATGLKLPLWLSEGLADVFSTVRVSEAECYMGGALPGRVQVLHHNAWMSVRDLFGLKESNLQTSRATAALFYAQSWGLTQMLALSKEYAPRFRDLVLQLDHGTAAADALQHVYGKSVDQIERDLRESVDGQRFERIRMPGIDPASTPIQMRAVSSFESDAVLADLVVATGQLDRARAMYARLSRIQPENADIWAALGKLALRQHDPALARTYWKRAMDYGTADAKLCFQYAELADDAGVAADEIRPVLERAIALEPQFDDAHYKLGLLESNAGRHAAAVRELKSMRDVSAERAYAYWSAMSYALNELDEREEAKRAAQKALATAKTPDERQHASELAYMAETDLAVQFARDASGRLQLVTTRVPHGTTDRNPFIEPGDRMQRSEGQLKAINCAGAKATGVVVETASGTLQLSIADPAQVQMRNAPESFTCGEQSARKVVVDYASATAAGSQGVVRGIEFR
jgi:tetratricopeptide (TPR) repeat protein